MYNSFCNVTTKYKPIWVMCATTSARTPARFCHLQAPNCFFTLLNQHAHLAADGQLCYSAQCYKGAAGPLLTVGLHEIGFA